MALIFANGALAGAEIAVISVRRGQLAELVEEGRHTALAVQHLRHDPERFLATVQIGMTLVSATAGALGGHNLAGYLTPLIAPLPVIGMHADGVALALVVLAISYLSLVLGELVPKSLALRSPMPYALVAARPLVLLARMGRPLVWFLTASSNAVLRAFGDQTTFTEARLSPDELARMVDEAAKSGAVHPKAGEIAMRALDFGEVTIGEVMIPRTRVVAIPMTATAEDIRRVLLEETHNHLPVYDNTLDEIVGIISTNDVLALAWEKELIVLQDLLRPPQFVPETMHAADVLRELQRQRAHFAIVVDERGGTAGIVTLKDLLEELVGEIFGEHDDKETPERIRPQPDGAFLVPGNMPIREANRALPFELPEGGDWSTVGGLCVALAGRIPGVGDHFVTAERVVIDIVDASQRRVRWARVGPARDVKRPG